MLDTTGQIGTLDFVRRINEVAFANFQVASRFVLALDLGQYAPQCEGEARLV